MQIEARDIWRSCWRAARVEFAALEQDCRFNGMRVPAGERLQRCRSDIPLQQLAYHVLDLRLVNDTCGYQWITGNKYRFLHVRAVTSAAFKDEEIPF
ncbi:hypothetical protein [Marinobacterium stanieri]|uniref:Uncharacterized protein n=1 Tax=Marinobacterium stanieri TaxID=49186 RepID=A0A1N6QC52_9GAMM|nr:hypothetical protein [Marinobacterium stanieri]SIQ14142.1 hypothetical protein SAMN05421647_102409 [Marinobacterium stanieri]